MEYVHDQLRIVKAKGQTDFILKINRDFEELVIWMTKDELKLADHKSICYDILGK